MPHHTKPATNPFLHQTVSSNDPSELEIEEMSEIEQDTHIVRTSAPASPDEPQHSLSTPALKVPPLKQQMFLVRNVR